MSMSGGCVGDGLGREGARTGSAAAPSGGCAAGVAERPDCSGPDAGSSAGPGTASGAAAVTDESTGATFGVAPGQVMLDAALDQGIALAHGCRNGVCGACAVEVLEGAENTERPDAIEANSLMRFRLPRGARLACRARVNGAVKIRPA